MKSNKFHYAKEQKIDITSLNGGLNLSSDNYKIENNQLSDCLNVWNKNSKLCVRPGLSSNLNSIIRYCSQDNDEDCQFNITTDTFVINDEECRLLTVSAFYDDSFFDYHVYSLSKNGNKTDLGTMSFSRVTSESFYCPYKILYYSGKPKNGGGIYALVSLYNTENINDKCNYIYEISSDLTDWSLVTNYYVPIIYINGKGSRVSELGSNQNYTESPIYLESPNMLTGAFKAYYTSDSYSSSFRLPVNDLALKTVKCRVYISHNNYVDWTISGSGDSNTQTIFNVSVTLTVDREKGIIYFTSANDEYSIPIMNFYRQNNIMITAYKNNESDYNDVVSCDHVLSCNSRIMVSGGNCKNRVYCAKYENPLYFPKNETVSIGNDLFNITATAKFKNNIIVFKQDETYLLNFSDGKIVNDTNLLADNNQIFYNSDTFKSSQLSTNIGCVNESTIKVVGNSLIFLSSDKKIMMLYGSSNYNIYNLSLPLNNQLTEEDDFNIKNSFSFIHDSYYILVIGNKAFALNYIFNNIKNVEIGSNSNLKTYNEWYIWKFNKSNKLICAYESYKNAYIICIGRDQKTCYLSVLANDIHIDSDIYKLESNDILSSIAIEEMLETKHFLHSNDKKHIISVFITAECDGIIEINYLTPEFSGKEKIKLKSGTESTINIKPIINNVNDFSIKLLSQSALSVSGFTIIYNTVEQI